MENVVLPLIYVFLLHVRYSHYCKDLTYQMAKNTKTRCFVVGPALCVLLVLLVISRLYEFGKLNDRVYNDTQLLHRVYPTHRRKFLVDHPDQGMAFPLESVDTRGQNWIPTTDRDTLLCINLYEHITTFRGVSITDAKLWNTTECHRILLIHFKKW